MAGTLPILQIRSSILLVGLLTAIPMTYYNEGKIFKIFKFLTHPSVEEDAKDNRGEIGADGEEQE